MNPRITIQQIESSARYVKKRIKPTPKIAIVLGSGLGESITTAIKNKKIIPYKTVPYFPVSTVPGHSGQLIAGELHRTPLLVLQGRWHFYEGYTLAQITFPIRVLKAIGIKTLILTCAAGGLNPNHHPGDLMLITDHINLIGDNPLIGLNDPAFGPRFPDMSEPYNSELITLARATAKKLNITLHQGVYTAVSGPNYETNAELKWLRKIGTDAIGMSTVPECIVANQIGLQVLGVVAITDVWHGKYSQPLSHTEVLKVANRISGTLSKLIIGIIKNIKC
ncbi:MAG: purine-nucleoside phosphorylase [bacterium]|nr:purine-nucleoside phosphorylase [bacterium]